MNSPTKNRGMVAGSALLVFMLSAAFSFSGDETAVFRKETAARYRDFKGGILAVNPRTAEEMVSVNRNCLYNEEYAPGSLIKIFLLYSLWNQKGFIDPERKFTCLPRTGEKLCWNPDGHGTINLYRAIACSCNFYFHRLAEEADYENFLSTLIKFNLIGEKEYGALLKIPAEERTEVMTGESPLLRVQPYRILLAFTSFFNNGMLWESSGGQKKCRNVDIAPRLIEIIRTGLRESALEGTGVAAQKKIPLSPILSKTGTSPTEGSDKTRGWFIGFYPAVDPSVGVLVFCRGGSGANDAAPVGGEIIRLYIETVNPGL